MYHDDSNSWSAFAKTTANYGSAACVIDNCIVRSGGTDSNTVQLLKLYVDSLSPAKSVCETKIPMAEVYHHTISSIGHNKALLAGGTYGFLNLSSNVYEGTLSVEKNDMQWKKVSSMSNARSSHAAFELDHKVYVVGGLVGTQWVKSSEVYDIEEQIWWDGPELPYLLTELYAVQDVRKTFALIVGEKSNDNEYTNVPVLLFDKENFFKELAEIMFKRFFGKTAVTVIE